MHLCWGAVVEVTFVSIKEEYLIVERVGATYFMELVHGLNTPISIHIARWSVMEFPVQWDVVKDILGVLLVLVNNYGRHAALPICYFEYK